MAAVRRASREDESYGLRRALLSRRGTRGFDLDRDLLDCGGREFAGRPLSQRRFSSSETVLRISKNLRHPSERRIAGSHLFFYNDGDVDDLRAFVRGAYERAEALLRERP